MDEIYVLFGALLLSGYSKYPNKMMYIGLPDVPPILQNSIRLNRFESFLRHVHLNDNSKMGNETERDRLYKLRPLLDHLNVVFQTHGGLEENLSIDESMIPYYGKHYAKQFIKCKPIRFGFKNWALCTSSGYLLTFELYTGKSEKKERVFGIGGDTVVSLIKQGNIPPRKGFKLFFDNYFSSVALLNHLAEMGYCATTTIQEARAANCPLTKKKVMEKQPRGYYEYQTDANDTIALMKWKDNKVVSCITNYDTIDRGTCTRYSRDAKEKVTVPQPKPIANYNKGMGGVDKMDQAVSSYRTRIRQKKWWWPIFVYLVDVSVSNAWLLMRKVDPENQFSSKGLLEFRR